MLGQKAPRFRPLVWGLLLNVYADEIIKYNPITSFRPLVWGLLLNLATEILAHKRT